MRKSRIILLVTMILLVACTCTVMGATQTGSGSHRNKTYSIKYEGSVTEFYAVGNTTQCYTTLHNDANFSCHIDALVREYNFYTSNALNQSYNVGTKGAGETIHSGYLSRDYDTTLYYYVHSANYYRSAYQMGEIVEAYKYTAEQQ